MKFRLIVNTLVLILIVTGSCLAIAESRNPEVTFDGLHLVKDSNLALVYAQPDAELAQYNKIYLADAYIAFQKNWQRKQNRSNPHKISSDDMAKMRLELSSLFRQVFSSTLEQGGYELVTERGEDVLLVKPAIINLDINSPDTLSGNPTHSYSESAGEMTLYLELYDSLSDDLIAKALDKKVDRQTGYFQWQNRVSNRAAANRILQLWADVLKNGLDEARGVPGS